MALGKPVIASAAGGNLEAITNDTNGRMVAPLQPAEWAHEELLTNPVLAQRLGAAARAAARERYALKHTVSRTAELYRSVVLH
jgi:glycosyltransferase involved in cell wall biosynthesis